MHLSRLTISEMLALSQPYLDPEHPAHQALAQIPDVARLLPRLRDAHQVLKASQSADDLRASSLQKEVFALEAEHDDLAQGIHYTCQGIALLAEQDELRTRWERLYEVLLPGNRKFASSSHKTEAGNAALLQQILEGLPAQDKGLLKAQYIGKRSLFEIIERWIAVGQELGQKELERQSVPVTPTGDSVQESRNQWTRTVGAIATMLQMAELLGELSAGVKEHVLIPLRAATDRRSPRRSQLILEPISIPTAAPAKDPTDPA